MLTIADVIGFLERFAPLNLAEKWDNVGLLLGDPALAAERVMTCLTLTPDVAAEAIARGTQLIITHHPILFSSVKRLTTADAQGRMLLDLVAARTAVYSPHTAYDSATEGINQQLATTLGLTDIAPLRTSPPDPEFKIVCFVPESHHAAVQEALWNAGAGRIGEYSQCSFVTSGTGTFLGSEASHPAVGMAGRLEHVTEVRIEVDCPQGSLNAALAGLRAAHPYEEPAFDVYPLQPTRPSGGVGRMGLLPREMPLAQFVELVKRQLHVPQLQYVGKTDQTVRRVGIACGAGGDLLPAAIGRGCDVVLTGEARFHAFLEAQTAGMALVLPGHYATERPAMEHLAGRLQKEFATLSVWASEREADPLQWTK